MTPEKVLEILKSTTSNSPAAWVAGSAAICPQLAEDIDIWLLGRGAIPKPMDYSPNIWTDLPPIGDEYTDTLSGVLARKKATIPAIGPNPAIKVQIMWTNWSAITVGLDQFYASCHKWARDLKGHFVGGSGATFPGQPIKLKEYPEWNGCDCPQCSKAKSAAAYHQTRLADFTARYADPTKFVLWLPS